MTSLPPFVIPTGLKIEPGLWHEVDIPPYSDGDPRHWPGRPDYRPFSDVVYRIKLGTAWAEEQGRAERNQNYYLKSLPSGYGTFETDQKGGKEGYKRLFGHPSGRFYDSIVRFRVHFLWLMSGMLGDCECVLCSKKPASVIPRQRRQLPWASLIQPSIAGQRKPREVEAALEHDSSRSTSVGGLASGRERRQPRAPGSAYAVDEEGTQDVWKDAIHILHKNRDSRRGTEIDIDEPNSIDWRAERDSLRIHLTKIDQQHSFIPRTGELVLWCPYFPDKHYLMRDPATGEFKFYSFDQKCFHGFPMWRGGVVTQVPTSTHGDDAIDFPDILEDPTKGYSLNTSGFRVETLPDPNGFDKSLSKQYKYVSLRHVRPLSHWQLLLRGIPEKRWHPSIKYALTCMTSISLVGKWRVNGEWPNAVIRCKACYLGCELVTVGETIRIAPSPRQKNTINGSTKQIVPVTDCLVVTDIRLNLEGIKEDHVPPVSPYLASRSFITFVGQAFSLDPQQDYRLLLPDSLALDGNAIPNGGPNALDPETVKSLFRPVGTCEYGNWYPLHAPNQRYEVSFDRVLGRLYEADAVRLWTGLASTKVRKGHLDQQKSARKPTIDFDVFGIYSGRAYATATDERLPEPNPADTSSIKWHWTDTRTQGLCLATVNGYDVAQYDEVRDPKTLSSWRAQLKVVDGGPLPEFEKDTGLKFLGKRGRKPGSRLINGRVVGPDELATAEGEMESESVSPTRGARIKSRTLSTSQMAGAALVETDDDMLEEISDSEPEIESEEPVQDEPTTTTTMLDNRPPTTQKPISISSRSSRESSVSSSGPKRRRLLLPRPEADKEGRAEGPHRTKEEIMTSVETSGEFDHDVPSSSSSSSDDEEDDEDEYAFLTKIPLARGGTEESSGGDYKPGMESQD